MPNESYPGETKNALTLFGRRDGRVRTYEMRDHLIDRLQREGIAVRSGDACELTSKGWSMIYDRRRAELSATT